MNPTQSNIKNTAVTTTSPPLLANLLTGKPDDITKRPHQKAHVFGAVTQSSELTIALSSAISAIGPDDTIHSQSSFGGSGNGIQWVTSLSENIDVFVTQ